ncbi:MAG: hypothetical protein J6Y44_00690 [Clostridia bacterium]|nr:hypothetical protein [Clostridia bacterium]
MILKVVLGFILVCISSLIGVKLTDKKRFVKDLFLKLKAFNLELSADVGLYYTPLKIKLDDFNKSVDGAIDGFERIFNAERYVCKDRRLNLFQREFISDYINSLGVFDEKGQIKYQDKTDKRIESFLADSEAVFSKYSALSTKLSFCLGLTLFIIIL